MSDRETRICRLIGAPSEVVYQLLLDAKAIPDWKVPDGMTCFVHAFEPWEGGNFRVSLSYLQPDRVGKTSKSTDTYSGIFTRLVPNTEVVERMQFETDDAAMGGWMTATYRLRTVGVDTELTALHLGVPEGVSLEDNKLGWSMSLSKLAKLAESRVARNVGQRRPA